MRIVTLALLVLFACSRAVAACGDLPDYQPLKLHSKERLDVCQHIDGKVTLLVNTASRCGFTPQFEGLEALYQQYRHQGFTVIGFPSDDFNQEYTDPAQTASVCYINYGVSFPMLASSPVRGDDANPVFHALAQAAGAPRWNFHKYLLDRQGRVVASFPSSETPRGGALEARIRTLLQPGER